jgi:hypothetical protein
MMGISVSAADGGDLILAQSDVLPKEGLQVRIRLTKPGQGGREGQNQQHGPERNNSSHAVCTSLSRCPAIVTKRFSGQSSRVCVLPD